jgi:hypothetical protein
MIYGLMCGISFITGMLVVLNMNGNSCISKMEDIKANAVCLPKNYTIAVFGGGKTFYIKDGNLVSISGEVVANPYKIGNYTIG